MRAPRGEGRRIRRPDSGSGRLPPGRRGRGLGEAGVLPSSEAVASSAAKDGRRRTAFGFDWAEISQQVADARPTSSSVDAVPVRVIGDTVAHLHPPGGR